MYDKRKALVAALNAIGFNRGDKLSVSQIGELERIMKDEYGLEVKVQQDDTFEKLKTAMDYLVLEKKPALEFCGTPPDGKARRRERRRQERLKLKRK